MPLPVYGSDFKELYIHISVEDFARGVKPDVLLENINPFGRYEVTQVKATFGQRRND